VKTNIKKYTRDNKIITLVGMCHIGTEAYYKETQREITETCSDVVLCEGLSGMEFNLTSMYRAIAKAIGLVMQKDFLFPRDNFITSDVDYSLLKSVNGSELKAMKKLEETESEMFELIKIISESKFLKALVLMVLKFGDIIKAISDKSDDFAVLQFRNNNVIQEAFQQLIENDSVSIVYGQGHMNGIESFLREAGFKCTNKIKLNPFK
jgi:ATP/ADP translocase